MPWPGSLRVRLTLWYSVLLAIPLIGFALASFFVVAGTLQSRTDRFLADALTTFSRELLAERQHAPSLEVAVRKTLEEVHFRDLHIAIRNSGGAILASTAPPGAAEPEAERLRERLDSVIAGYGEGLGARHPALGESEAGVPPIPIRMIRIPESFRVLAIPLVVDGRELLITGAYALGDLEGVLRGLRRLFLIAIPLLIAAAATGGYALARGSLAPVTAMSRRAEEITATNLGERLPVGGARELAGLAVVINRLLDRLEGAFAQQRRLVADASHELRTPTAIVRSEADVTLSQPHRDEAEYRESMGVILDAARRLTRVVDDLFLLARSEAGQQVLRPEPLYLEDVVQDAARAMAKVAEQRRVEIAVTGITELPMRGDGDLLGRLLLNLLDNAVRYSPARGVVELHLARRNGRYEVSVTDQGPGIPSEAQARVFEPFFRGDSSRTRETPGDPGGAGLGLAIARRIAEMHAGVLEIAESRPGRTVFRLSLPG